MKNDIWYWRDKIRYQILVFGKWFEGQSVEAEKGRREWRVEERDAINIAGDVEGAIGEFFGGIGNAVFG